jgi:hypothetical protein
MSMIILIFIVCIYINLCEANGSKPADIWIVGHCQEAEIEDAIPYQQNTEFNPAQFMPRQKK